MFPGTKMVPVLAAVLLSAPFARCQDAPKMCSFTFRVVDRAGVTLPFKVNRFPMVYPAQKDYSGNFTGSTAVVPCGFYQYDLSRLDVPASVRMMGGVEVTAPESWLTVVYVDINGTRTRPPEYVFRGRVLNANPGAKLWIRLQSAFTPEANVEAQVGPEGDFRFYWLPRGLCLLYVMADDQIQYIESLTVENSLSVGPISVDLAQPVPKDRIIK